MSFWNRVLGGDNDGDLPKEDLGSIKSKGSSKIQQASSPPRTKAQLPPPPISPLRQATTDKVTSSPPQQPATNAPLSSNNNYGRRHPVLNIEKPQNTTNVEQPSYQIFAPPTATQEGHSTDEKSSSLQPNTAKDIMKKGIVRFANESDKRISHYVSMNNDKNKGQLTLTDDKRKPLKDVRVSFAPNEAEEMTALATTSHTGTLQQQQNIPSNVEEVEDENQSTNKIEYNCNQSPIDIPPQKDNTSPSKSVTQQQSIVKEEVIEKSKKKDQSSKGTVQTSKAPPPPPPPLPSSHKRKPPPPSRLQKEKENVTSTTNTGIDKRNVMEPIITTTMNEKENDNDEKRQSGVEGHTIDPANDSIIIDDTETPKSMYSPRFNELFENVPSELQKVQEASARRRHDFHRRIHDMDCRLASCMATLANMAMDREASLQNWLGRNVYEPLDKAADNVYMTIADGGKPSRRCQDVQSRLIQFDTQMTLHEYVTLRDAKNNNLRSLRNDIQNTTKQHIDKETNRSERRHEEICRAYESTAGVIFRQYRVLQSKRISSIESMNKTLNDALVDEHSSMEELLSTIQNLRKQLREERTERIKQDEYVLSEIVTKTTSMKRALMEAATLPSHE